MSHRKVGTTLVDNAWATHQILLPGRMLNRFSKDVVTVDTSLAGSLQQVNQSLANFAASVITVV